jgi:hypothetical protein
MLAKSRPIKATLPALGASSPPSRCSSVLLPEPEAPTTASVSPRLHIQAHTAQHGHVQRIGSAAFDKALVQVHRLQHGLHS